MSDRESEGHASAVRILATAPEVRLQEIKSRRLEIAETVTEWKRAYYVDSVRVPLTERLAIQAEDARLMRELDTLKVAAERAKYIRRKQERQSLLDHLVAVLREREMKDVIAEAQSRADKAAA
jgi:hypothetical protein